MVPDPDFSSPPLLCILGQIVKRVLNRELAAYDTKLSGEIQEFLPKRLDSCVQKIQRKVLPCLPSTRDDFRASEVLREAPWGENVLLLDTQNEEDLPPDWHRYSLRDLMNYEDGVSVLHCGQQIWTSG